MAALDGGKDYQRMRNPPLEAYLLFDANPRLNIAEVNGADSQVQHHAFDSILVLDFKSQTFRVDKRTSTRAPHVLRAVFIYPRTLKA